MRYLFLQEKGAPLDAFRFFSNNMSTDIQDISGLGVPEYYYSSEVIEGCKSAELAS